MKTDHTEFKPGDAVISKEPYIDTYRTGVVLEMTESGCMRINIDALDGGVVPQLVLPQRYRRLDFQVWRFRSVTFLAARSPEGYLICDQLGHYYGAWQDIASFRKHQRDQVDAQALVGTVASISIHAVPIPLSAERSADSLVRTSRE
jgi:hypothetical protein